MEDVGSAPEWLAFEAPIHNVTADCVLEWPDEKNPNEFPLLCPVHGILSRRNVKSTRACCICCVDRAEVNAESTDTTPRVRPRREYNSVGDLLKMLWNGEGIPCLLKTLNGGTPADSIKNRRVAFNGDQLALTPRGPVIVNSHSLRAKNECDPRKPYVHPDTLPLSAVYAYLKDLGLPREWCLVFKSQIRHVHPDGVRTVDLYLRTVAYRKRNHRGLLINIFPGTKCFITYVDYSEFDGRPDLNYGDQVLELDHCILETDDEVNTKLNDHDVFYLRVRPCPYLRRHTIKLGPCLLATESDAPIYGRMNLRSYSDLGISIHKGRITAVAYGSPARKAGLEPDDHLVEIAGTSVVYYGDDQMIDLLRHAISENPTRSVEVVVIPERIHAQLQSIRNFHYVISNQGFHLGPWMHAAPFGLSSQKPRVIQKLSSVVSQ